MMTFDEWWKEMKPAECDELKDEFVGCWEARDAEVAELQGQVGLLLRTAKALTIQQHPDVAQRTLCYADKTTGEIFYLFEGIPPRHRSWVRQPQYDKLITITEEEQENVRVPIFR